MRINKNATACTVAGVVAALAIGVAAPAAQAATNQAPARTAVAQVQTYTAASGVKPPAGLIGPNGEKPKKWGVATFPANAKGTLASHASKGGGTWTYGTGTDGRWKGCYSNFIHPSKKHSASVAIATQTDKDIQEADKWAKAYAKNGWDHTCRAYWGVY
ncbi:lactococcin 972 family bacteriocin [Streptomyces platensis]|uniref:lactococcin 972 family bacteriocin n=1 Tax=Streptomyces platensis TaxID=58346 RepID=UPI00333041A2